MEGETTQEIKEFYDNYISRQLKVGINERHYSISREFEKYFDKEKQNTILEVGCGIGTLSELIIKKIKNNDVFIGVDISEKSVKVARDKFNSLKNVSFRTFDLTQNILSEKFDIIILADVIEHIPLSNHAALFDNLYKIIKKNGVLIIHYPHPLLQEWLKVNHPEKMQIIDQTIHYPEIVSVLYDNNFDIIYTKAYSIWRIPFDYQFVIAKPKYDYTNIKEKTLTISLFSKIKYKLKKIL